MHRPFSLLLAAFALLGCRAKAEPAPEPAPRAAAHGASPGGFCTGCGKELVYAEKDVVPGALAKPGDLTRCPVSNVVFRVDEDSPRVEHAGKRGFVCCEGCKQHFVANPEKFAKLL